MRRRDLCCHLLQHICEIKDLIPFILVTLLATVYLVTCVLKAVQVFPFVVMALRKPDFFLLFISRVAATEM